MKSQLAKIQNIQKSSEIARALALLVALLVLLGIVYVGHASRTTLTGQHVYDSQMELDRINHEIVQLEYDIAVLTAPSRITEIALKMGLRPPSLAQIKYMVIKNYPASTPKLPLRPNDLASAPASSDAFGLASLWNELLSLIGLAPHGRAVEASP
jgi:cell division protein FtsL